MVGVKLLPAAVRTVKARSTGQNCGQSAMTTAPAEAAIRAATMARRLSRARSITAPSGACRPTPTRPARVVTRPTVVALHSRCTSRKTLR